MKNTISFLSVVYVWMCLVIFILPFFSFENYSIIQNTTSELGAQNTPNAWVMNLTFMLLGVAAIFDGWKLLGNFWFQKIALLVFGGALFFTGIYSHAPIDDSVSFEVWEDKWHSYFATLTGWAFTMFAISMGFVETTWRRKLLAFGIGILATMLSILIFQVPEIRGIWQRMIFIFSFGWMVFVFRKNSFVGN